jgi:hypothetical protein
MKMRAVAASVSKQIYSNDRYLLADDLTWGIFKSSIFSMLSVTIRCD